MSDSSPPAAASLSAVIPRSPVTRRRIAIIGAGPAGLAAAERLIASDTTMRDAQIDLYDAMPSVGRKFLRAGIGGLNVTHSEPYEAFCARFGSRPESLQRALDAFPPDALRAWASGLGVETFVGTSGRVFPAEMKAAPLLRAWLHRLRAAGVTVHTRHRWLGWAASADAAADLSEAGSAVAGPAEAGPTQGVAGRGRGTVPTLRFDTPSGIVEQPADAVVLALGGGSWPQLGSDGSWVPWLEAQHIPVNPLRSANGGFAIAWSAHLRERFAGAPLKSVALSFTDASGEIHRRQGECVVSARGVEGSLIYAFSRALRESIEVTGSASFTLDLVPGRDALAVADAVSHPRGSRSLSSHLQSRLGLTGVKAALLYEVLDRAVLQDSQALAHAIKALPLTVHATLPLAEAISSAGGVAFAALDDDLMVRHMPGVFVAGEMLDWEAPTGGYLLTACLATGRLAGQGVTHYMERGSHGVAVAAPSP
ncbi:TIGR03862 family flavoprotein [Robbsia sp. KACC 23696]|uniref:TIGR03862 family flavoprotein n=1 Tax=Robbsia sp. KACC 23696 TaxID=3149231 RepID=UPI00325BA781